MADPFITSYRSAMQSNKQIIAYSGLEYKNENHSHSCPRCDSSNLRSGAGRKPNEESRRCGNCGEFLGYLPVERLKKLRKRRNLTDSLNLLESHGIVSQEAQIFALSNIGAMGGESWANSFPHRKAIPVAFATIPLENAVKVEKIRTTGSAWVLLM